MAESKSSFELKLQESDLYILCYDFDVGENNGCIFQSDKVSYLLMRSIIQGLGFQCDIPQELTRDGQNLLQFGSTYPVERFEKLTERAESIVVTSVTA